MNRKIENGKLWETIRYYWQKGYPTKEHEAHFFDYVRILELASDFILTDMK